MHTRTIQGTYFPTSITRVDYDETFTERAWVRVEQPACVNGVVRTLSMPLPDAVGFTEALIEMVGSVAGPEGLAKLSAAVDMAIVEQNSSIGELTRAYKAVNPCKALERLAASAYGRN